MANPISDFMSNWLNSTYKYLKESGRGPTYPPATPITVGPEVIPGGAYSTVEEYPITYGFLPIPFNPGATGIPATAGSRDDAIAEEAKQNVLPPVFSKNFGLLYGNSMAACIADQKHRACNPNTINACRTLAETGDASEMNLMLNQRNALGIAPPSQKNSKSDDIRLSENEANLTDQIKTGFEGITNIWTAFARGLGAPIKRDPSGNDTPAENPAGINFQAIGEKIIGFIPTAPTMPDTGTIVMIGGTIVLVMLLMAIIK